MSKAVKEKRVTLFAAIYEHQHEALRELAYTERKSIAELTREALDSYLSGKINDYEGYVKSKSGK